MAPEEQTSVGNCARGNSAEGKQPESNPRPIASTAPLALSIRSTCAMVENPKSERCSCSDKASHAMFMAVPKHENYLERGTTPWKQTVDAISSGRERLATRRHERLRAIKERVDAYGAAGTTA